MTTAYAITEAAPVTLAGTVYRVEVQTHADGTEMTTWLHGPKGAIYFLRPYLERNGDTGLRQVISWKSGQPLRKRGNEVRVHILGDLIEQAA